MPGKSHHNRKKLQKKKRQGVTVGTPSVIQQPKVLQTAVPAVPSVTRVISAKDRSEPAVAKYPYVAAELQRIVILAGIIIVILFVLFFVL